MDLNKLPKARTADVIVQHLKTEVLVYDLKDDRAYCLNETSAQIYKHCDGKTTFEEMKRRYKYTDDLIFFALDELRDRNLLDDAEYVSTLAGLSRREAIKRVGLASMIALPVVMGLIAPQAINAASNSTCPVGANLTDQGGIIGNGGICTCGPNAPGGTNCGRGVSLSNSVTTLCRTGCVCTVLTSNPQDSIGICG